MARPHARHATLVLLAMALSHHAAHAVRFALGPGTKRCFTEDLPSERKIQASVAVSDGKGAMEIDVWVTTLDDRVLYHRRASEHGRFSFDTPAPRRTAHSGIDDDDVADDYGWSEDTFRVCVEHQSPGSHTHEVGMHRFVTLVLDQAAAGAGAGRRGALAKVDHADNLADALHVMHRGLYEMVQDLGRLQAREHALVKHVQQTGARVSILSAVAILAAACVAAAQLHYFRRYFAHKKLC